MNRDKVIDAVRDIMAKPRAFEAERLERIASALRPWDDGYDAAHALVTRTDEPAYGMKWRSQTNFLPLVVDTYAQSMKVDNYLASDTKETAEGPWEWWQRNKFDARQTGIIRSVLTYGVSYVTVLPSLHPLGGPDGAYLRALSPRQMTCLYGDPIEWTPGETPVDDDWPIMALEMKGAAIRLYDEENVYFVGVQNVPQSALGWRDPMFTLAGNFKFLEARPHNVGVCPVVRFRDRWLLEGEEQFGIVEPLMNIQGRIDSTTYEMSVAQYFTAFIQRWVTGWRPQNDSEALAAVAGDVWYFNKADVSVGQFQQGDLNGYIESKRSAIRDLAAIGQIPAQNLGVDALANISEATLAGLEKGKQRKTAEIQTALGESFEQMLRTCAYITGDTKSAEDFASEVKWQDATARSYGETIDGLGKLKQMLDLPDELLWEDVPGKTKQWVDRAIELRDAQPEPPPPPVAVAPPEQPMMQMPPGGAKSTPGGLNVPPRTT